MTPLTGSKHPSLLSVSLKQVSCPTLHTHESENYNRSNPPCKPKLFSQITIYSAQITTTRNEPTCNHPTKWKILYRRSTPKKTRKSHPQESNAEDSAKRGVSLQDEMRSHRPSLGGELSEHEAALLLPNHQSQDRKGPRAGLCHPEPGPGYFDPVPCPAQPQQ